jgi:transmembrane sensor
MNQDNRLWILMSRHLSGEATPDEEDELHSLLDQSPDKQYLYSILHSWFADLPSPSTSKPAEDPDFENRFRRIVGGNPEEAPAGTIIRPHRRRRLLYISSIAASLMALFLFSWMLYRNRSTTPSPSVNHEEVLARAGTRTRLVLPDGSQVWLNSSSKLKYSNDFNRESREVALEGEAYFDVTKDSKRPFIVHTSSLDVRVLGTSFTVKSYPQDPTIETTLLKGSIEVSRKDNPNTARVILKPNEKLVFNRIASPVATIAPNRISLRTAPQPDIAVNSIPMNIPDSNKVETAWMYNRLVFQGDNFRELAEKMERWYNVRITIRDSSLYGCRFGGAFANETIEEAIQALQLTSATAFTYEINGNGIELHAKK